MDFCDWKNTPLGGLLATPKDGKPISEYPNPNKAFNIITDEIRRVISEIDKQQPESCKAIMTESLDSSEQEPKSVVIDKVRSSNLTIKKEFSDYEKDTFKKDAFIYIAKFFKNSLEELDRRNGDINYEFEKELNRFHATIYRSGHEIASCLVINRIGDDFFGGITYSYNKNSGSINSSLSIEEDGYSMFLTPTLGMSGGNNQLSKKGAADFFWEMLIQSLQNN